MYHQKWHNVTFPTFYWSKQAQNQRVKKSSHIFMWTWKITFQRNMDSGKRILQHFSKNLPYPFIVQRVRQIPCHTAWVKEEVLLRKGKLTSLNSAIKPPTFISSPCIVFCLLVFHCTHSRTIIGSCYLSCSKWHLTYLFRKRGNILTVYFYLITLSLPS